MRNRAPSGAVAVTLTCLIALAWPPGLARAQEELTVKGTVTGELAGGERADFRVTATHPQGWRTLQTLTTVLDLRGAPLEELTYDVDEGALSAEGEKALVGTGDDVNGRFFRVSALDVTVTTGGDELTLAFAADVLEPPPSGARFRFIAEDDLGEEVSVGVKASVQGEDGGVSLVTVILAIGAALLAGGFVGAQFTGRRRPATSIYGTVHRRIQEERRGTPPPRGDRRQ